MTNPAPRTRPVIRNIHVTDLANYKLPLPGILSILHRVSGALMFVLLPLLLWLFDLSLNSESTYARLHGFTSFWPVKLVLVGLGWLLAHHLCAGIRYLALDLDLGVDLQAARRSANLVFGASLLATLVLLLFAFGVL